MIEPESVTDATLSDRIVDTAIALAEEVGWDGVRLRLVADRLGVPLEEVGACFPDLDGVADAWFARAWQAMLAPPPDDFAEWPERERIKVLLERWFGALAPHRRVTVQMLQIKLWPFHPHHWVPMIFNLSRTVLWLRDAAALDAGGPRQALEEVGLTWLFVLTLAVWAMDDTTDQARTARFLDRRLNDAETAMRFLFGRGRASTR
jgi:AcrR family transcriptional regulator